MKNVYSSENCLEAHVMAQDSTVLFKHRTNTALNPTKIGNAHKQNWIGILIDHCRSF